MARVLDFNATRAELRGSLAKAEAAYSKSIEVVGEVALDVKMGKRPQSDLDAAREDEVGKGRLVAEAHAALAALDVREADAAASDADRQRAADERRLQELAAICTVAGKKVLKLSADLADACAEGAAAAGEAVAIGQKHDINTSLISRWPSNASAVIHARLNESKAVPGFMYGGHPEDVAKLEDALRQPVA